VTGCTTIITSGLKVNVINISGKSYGNSLLQLFEFPLDAEVPLTKIIIINMRMFILIFLAREKG
jgi:hypothetical protein